MIQGTTTSYLKVPSSKFCIYIHYPDRFLWLWGCLDKWVDSTWKFSWSFPILSIPYGSLCHSTLHISTGASL